MTVFFLLFIPLLPSLPSPPIVSSQDIAQLLLVAQITRDLIIEVVHPQIPDEVATGHRESYALVSLSAPRSPTKS